MENDIELLYSREKIADHVKLSDMTVKPNKNKLFYTAFFVFCFMLIAISVFVHLCIFAFFVDSLLGESSDESLLLYVLPSFNKREAYFEEERTEIEIPIKKPSEDNKGVEEDGKADEVPPIENTVKEGVVSLDLSCEGFALKNETKYTPDLEALFNSPEPIDKLYKLNERYIEGSPLVLIYHTHATESYYDTNDTLSYRSKEPEKNMIAVGKVISDILVEKGVPTIHLTEQFDSISYSEAYQKSAAAVDEIMRKYPSIQYVIDVHRDSVTDVSGANVSADAVYNGQRLAQLMFVCGTDEGGSGHTKWRENLTFSLQLQNMLQSKCGNIMRPINLRRASFYQDKSPGAVILEIGTTGNTLGEAKTAAVLFAEILAEYVKGKSSN